MHSAHVPRIESKKHTYLHQKLTRSSPFPGRIFVMKKNWENWIKLENLGDLEKTGKPGENQKEAEKMDKFEEKWIIWQMVPVNTQTLERNSTMSVVPH